MKSTLLPKPPRAAGWWGFPGVPIGGQRSTSAPPSPSLPKLWDSPVSTAEARGSCSCWSRVRGWTVRGTSSWWGKSSGRSRGAEGQYFKTGRRSIRRGWHRGSSPQSGWGQHCCLLPPPIVIPLRMHSGCWNLRCRGGQQWRWRSWRERWGQRGGDWNPATWRHLPCLCHGGWDKLSTVRELCLTTNCCAMFWGAAYINRRQQMATDLYFLCQKGQFLLISSVFWHHFQLFVTLDSLFTPHHQVKLLGREWMWLIGWTPSITMDQQRFLIERSVKTKMFDWLICNSQCHWRQRCRRGLGNGVSSSCPYR